MRLTSPQISGGSIRGRRAEGCLDRPQPCEGTVNHLLGFGPPRVLLLLVNVLYLGKTDPFARGLVRSLGPTFLSPDKGLDLHWFLPQGTLDNPA